MPLFPVTYPDDKPGAGLASVEAGHRLSHLDGAWVVEAEDQAGADACQQFLRDYDDLAKQRADAKDRVKDEAQRRILFVVPLWKQINATARGVELLRNMILAGGLTAGEQAEAQAALGLFDSVIKPIRAASDEIEADVDAMSAGEAHEFDPATSDRWPG